MSINYLFPWCHEHDNPHLCLNNKFIITSMWHLYAFIIKFVILTILSQNLCSNSSSFRLRICVHYRHFTVLIFMSLCPSIYTFSSLNSSNYLHVFILCNTNRSVHLISSWRIDIQFIKISCEEDVSIFGKEFSIE